MTDGQVPEKAGGVACRTQVDKPWTGRRDTPRHATTVKVRQRTFIHIYVSMMADSVETMLSKLNSFTSYSTSQRHAGPAPGSTTVLVFLQCLWQFLFSLPAHPSLLTRTLNVEGLQSMVLGSTFCPNCTFSLGNLTWFLAFRYQLWLGAIILNAFTLYKEQKV